MAPPELARGLPIPVSCQHEFNKTICSRLAAGGPAIGEWEKKRECLFTWGVFLLKNSCCFRQSSFPLSSLSYEAQTGAGTEFLHPADGSATEGLSRPPSTATRTQQPASPSAYSRDHPDPEDPLLLFLLPLRLYPPPPFSTEERPAGAAIGALMDVNRNISASAFLVKAKIQRETDAATREVSLAAVEPPTTVRLTDLLASLDETDMESSCASDYEPEIEEKSHSTQQGELESERGARPTGYSDSDRRRRYEGWAISNAASENLLQWSSKDVLPNIQTLTSSTVTATATAAAATNSTTSPYSATSASSSMKTFSRTRQSSLSSTRSSLSSGTRRSSLSSTSSSTTTTAGTSPSSASFSSSTRSSQLMSTPAATVLTLCRRFHPVPSSALFLESLKLGDYGAIVVASVLRSRKYRRAMRSGDKPKTECHNSGQASIPSARVFLRRILLASNGIGDKGVIAISEALSGVQPSISCSDSHLYHHQYLTYHNSPSNLQHHQSTDQSHHHLESRAWRNRPPSVKELGLQFNSFGAAGVNAIATALARNPSLQILDLSGNSLSGNVIAPLAHTLASNESSLSVLKLHYAGIGDEGINALADGLKSNRSLRELVLSYNSFSSAGVAALSDALTVNCSTRFLDLSWNKIDAVGAAAIAGALAKNHTVEILDLSSNRLGNAGAAAIAESIITSENTALKRLALARNEIDQDGVSGVVPLLFRRCHSVMDVCLSSNRVGSGVGAVAIAKALAATPPHESPRNTLRPPNGLTILALSGAHLGDEGCIALSKGVAFCSTLAALVLSGNAIGNIGAAALAASFESGQTCMKHLDLTSNEIGPTGALAFANVLGSTHVDNRSGQSLPPFSLISAPPSIAGALRLPSCPLRTLVLNNNAISNRGAVLLARALEFNRTLEKLDLAANTIGDVGGAEIASRIPGSLVQLLLTANRVSDPTAVALAARLPQAQALRTLSIAGNPVADPGLAAIAAALRYCRLAALRIDGTLSSRPLVQTVVAPAARFNTTLVDMSLDRFGDGVGVLADVVARNRTVNAIREQAVRDLVAGSRAFVVVSASPDSSGRALLKAGSNLKQKGKDRYWEPASNAAAKAAPGTPRRAWPPELALCVLAWLYRSYAVTVARICIADASRPGGHRTDNTAGVPSTFESAAAHGNDEDGNANDVESDGDANSDAGSDEEEDADDPARAAFDTWFGEDLARTVVEAASDRASIGALSPERGWWVPRGASSGVFATGSVTGNGSGLDGEDAWGVVRRCQEWVRLRSSLHGERKI
ncbi:hypothetical protein DFJ73DRAFT_868353 [Zopfochytrium polystomum]|nr:hypothetical protein DFJ73DRAFT_868353 [Zopfochytrium polystomum]